MVPPAVLQLFRNYCRELALFAFDRKLESDRILRLLARHHISARLYKGLDLSQLLYNDLAMREFTDMDLIIDATQVKSIVDVMHTAGYTMQLEDYYKRHPLHYSHHSKDLLFGKRNARGTWLNFELHYRPTKALMPVCYTFPELLGADYLARDYTYEDYYKIMLVNNGASDFYPHLRSLLDMLLLYRHGPFNLPPELKRFEYLWQQLAVSLLEASFEISPPDKTFPLLRKRLLRPEPAKYSFLQQAWVNVVFGNSFHAKYRAFIRHLSFLLRPNANDFAMVRLPFVFLYYLTKPFRLAANLFARLK
jgi:hypothetical protein